MRPIRISALEGDLERRYFLGNSNLRPAYGRYSTAVEYTDARKSDDIGSKRRRIRTEENEKSRQVAVKEWSIEGLPADIGHRTSQSLGYAILISQQPFSTIRDRHPAL